ncbi:MAG: DUF4167 domain-containing protein [Hyphomonadaceae bacterium]
MKRQRGRGRKPGGGGGGGGGNNNHNHGNRSLESNGPDVKIRGTAAQIYEKYAQYARDAQSGGDRVRYETYLQHAEHYYRVMAASMPRERLLQQQEAGLQAQTALDEGDAQQNDGNGYSEQPDATRANEQHGQNHNNQHNNQHNGQNNNDADHGDDENDADGEDRHEAEQPNRDVQAREGQPQPQDAQGNDGGQEGSGRGRRRRGRRRNNEGGQDAGGEAAGGGDTEARSALDSLARKQGALAGG